MPYNFAPHLPTKAAYATAMYSVNSHWSNLKDLVAELKDVGKQKKLHLPGQLCLKAAAAESAVFSQDVGVKRCIVNDTLFITFNNPTELSMILDDLRWPETEVKGVVLWNKGRFTKH
jgi:hypothetical protein